MRALPDFEFPTGVHEPGAKISFDVYSTRKRHPAHQVRHPPPYPSLSLCLSLHDRVLPDAHRGLAFDGDARQKGGRLKSGTSRLLVDPLGKRAERIVDAVLCMYVSKQQEQRKCEEGVPAPGIMVPLAHRGCGHSAREISTDYYTHSGHNGDAQCCLPAVRCRTPVLAVPGPRPLCSAALSVLVKESLPGGGRMYRQR